MAPPSSGATTLNDHQRQAAPRGKADMVINTSCSDSLTRVAVLETRSLARQCPDNPDTRARCFPGVLSPTGPHCFPTVISMTGCAIGVGDSAGARWSHHALSGNGESRGPARLSSSCDCLSSARMNCRSAMASFVCQPWRKLGFSALTAPRFQRLRHAAGNGPYRSPLSTCTLSRGAFVRRFSAVS